MRHCIIGLCMVVIWSECTYAQGIDSWPLRNACEKIPQWALDRADVAIKRAYPGWNAIPALGDDGEWRCRTSGAYVRRYDRMVEGKRVAADIPLFVDRDGSIFIADRNGCFSIDRWR